MEPAIRVENLSKKYLIRHQAERAAPYDTFRDALGRLFKPGRRSSREEFWALSDLSFEVQPGEVLGIIGRNGAGKSTLLKLLARITEPTKGRIELNGRTASLLEVGTGFHPELTGRENIYLNGAILGMSRAEIRKRFDEIVDFAGVEKFIDTPVKRYSSGMSVRLAFAVAAHLEPEILIVDEVLAVGDFEFKSKSLKKMKEVSERGQTTVFVSHQLNAVRQLCTSCILLESGKITTKGSTGDVLSRYVETGTLGPTTPLPTHLPDGNEVPIRISNLYLGGADGSPGNVFEFGSSWELQVDFSVREAIPDFVLRLGLQQTGGIKVQTAWTEPGLAKIGEYHAKFSQNKVSLECNSYDLVLGFNRGPRTIFQVDVGRIEIVRSPSETRRSMAAEIGSGYGIVLNSMETSIKKYS